MAGLASNRRKGDKRGFTPAASQEWEVLGFSSLRANAALPGASSTGRQDVRVPLLPLSQINQVKPTNWQGLQLRQYQSLLSRRYNVSFRAGVLAEQKPPQVQLATNKVQTGLGVGVLKNRNINAVPAYNNLLAKASAYGRLSQKIPIN